MKPVRTFTVAPKLPPALARLRDLAYNLRWAWNHDAIALFRRLDRELWETSGHNPVLMLGTIDQRQLEAVAADEGFLGHLERVSREFDAYMAGEASWFRRVHDGGAGPLVAYFSAEFGLTECLPIFAGGLGLLAGDHLKSASDLGVPLVGVGLLYQQGYFRQLLSEAGWQEEATEDNDFYNLPLYQERGPDGQPLTVAVAFPGRQVLARIWRAQVGRVALYLLDANLGANTPEDRVVTDQLYGGDLEMRLKQEILLGIGGCRALAALGLAPTVYHVNEGHAAFLGLERIHQLRQMHGLSFAEAREVASAGIVFTSHTPVPAGHDYFPPDLLARYFADYARELGLSLRELLALGRQNPNDEGEHFCMTVLALRLAAHSNGVSRLHGHVTRQMWQRVWPGVPTEEEPIIHVTNGVHFRSWISQEMDQLYDRYLGPRWEEEPADEDVWQAVEHVPAEELWRTHERRRERMVAFARRRLRAQLERRGAPQAEVEAADEALDLDALTIGFARRFAEYKRASLIFHDVEQLKKIVKDTWRPVQLVFAGKSHPADFPSKHLLHQTYMFGNDRAFQGRVAFIEDYDMHIARYLVQGVDVWLNTPRRLQEASGTSGMKAAVNGALNMSIMDGWWAEGYNGKNGWAINPDIPKLDAWEEDRLDSQAIYRLLEDSVVPLFYERDRTGVPHKWTQMVKESIGSIVPRFSARRMLKEYAEQIYIPAAQSIESRILK